MCLADRWISLENLDSFFKLMKDGRWHGVTEIAKNMQLSEGRVENVVQLFANANLATFDRKTRKVKLDSELCELYVALEEDGN